MNGYIGSPVPAAGQFILESPSEISLETPDYAQMRQDRYDRNKETMQAHNRQAAAQVFPEKDSCQSPEVMAAIKIQANMRGYLGRKRYTELLYEQFEQEEESRRKKVLQQVAEGESLVEIHNLEVQLDDNATTRRNKSRHLNSQVITIQRAWRAYTKRQHEMHSKAENNSETAAVNNQSDTDKNHTKLTREAWGETTNNRMPDISGANLENTDFSRESTPGIQNNSRESSPGFGYFLKSKSSIKANADSPECESVASDYSELAEAIKEHFTESEIQIVKKEDLTEGVSLPIDNPTVQVERMPGEDDDDYFKRVRKTNLLSLAQEFDALKRINPDALPFDLHKGNNRQPLSPASDSGSCMTQSVTSLKVESPSDENRVSPVTGITSDSTEIPIRKIAWSESNKTDSKYSEQKGRNVRPTLPSEKGESAINEQKGSYTKRGDTETDGAYTNLDIWGKVDEQIQKAEAEKQIQTTRRNDREEIRRRLAAETWDDENYYGGERMYKKPNLQTRMQSGMNLQICFVNESYSDSDSTSLNEDVLGTTVAKKNTVGEPLPHRPTEKTRQIFQENIDKQNNHIKNNHGMDTKERNKKANGQANEDFFTKQDRLQLEAKLALAQAKPMAQMQLEIEKIERQSRRTSVVAEMIGIPGFTGGKWKMLSQNVLVKMNLAQLQVLVNDLHTNIEAFNEELMNALIERDDLHMGQDSMLVDIEDLTRHAQECAQRNDVKAGKKTGKKR